MPSISVAILGAGALGVGGSIASSMIGSNAAQSAANAQAQAAQTAANTQLGIFNQTQQNLAPYNQMGQSALQQLAQMFGLGGNTATPGSPAALFGFGTGGPSATTAANSLSALSQYPGYQFGLNQGIQALDRSAASQGLLLSGGQLKAAQQYGQGYAQQNAWQPYLNQLNTYASQVQGIANLGENAGAMTGSIGQATGANVANSINAGGAATASGIVGSANALTGGLQSGLNSGLNSSLLAFALQNAGAGNTWGPGGNGI